MSIFWQLSKNKIITFLSWMWTFEPTDIKYFQSMKLLSCLCIIINGIHINSMFNQVFNYLQSTMLTDIRKSFCFIRTKRNLGYVSKKKNRQEFSNLTSPLKNNRWFQHWSLDIRASVNHYQSPLLDQLRYLISWTCKLLDF